MEKRPRGIHPNLNVSIVTNFHDAWGNSKSGDLEKGRGMELHKLPTPEGDAKTALSGPALRRALRFALLAAELEGQLRSGDYLARRPRPYVKETNYMGSEPIHDSEDTGPRGFCSVLGIGLDEMMLGMFKPGKDGRARKSPINVSLAPSLTTYQEEKLKHVAGADSNHTRDALQESSNSQNSADGANKSNKKKKDDVLFRDRQGVPYEEPLHGTRYSMTFSVVPVLLSDDVVRVLMETKDVTADKLEEYVAERVDALVEWMLDEVFQRGIRFLLGLGLVGGSQSDRLNSMQAEGAVFHLTGDRHISIQDVWAMPTALPSTKTLKVDCDRLANDLEDGEFGESPELYLAYNSNLPFDGEHFVDNKDVQVFKGVRKTFQTLWPRFREALEVGLYSSYLVEGKIWLNDQEKSSAKKTNSKEDKAQPGAEKKRVELALKHCKAKVETYVSKYDMVLTPEGPIAKKSPVVLNHQPEPEESEAEQAEKAEKAELEESETVTEKPEKYTNRGVRPASGAKKKKKPQSTNG